MVIQISGERRGHLINVVGETGLLCGENKIRSFLQDIQNKYPLY